MNDFKIRFFDCSSELRRAVQRVRTNRRNGSGPSEARVRGSLTGPGGGNSGLVSNNDGDKRVD